MLASMTSWRSPHVPPASRIGLQAWSPGEGPAADHIGLDEHQGSVADHPDRLSRSDEIPDELHGCVVRAQLVGIADSPGQHDAVEVGYPWRGRRRAIA